MNFEERLHQSVELADFEMFCSIMDNFTASLTLIEFNILVEFITTIVPSEWIGKWLES